ncbi:MAG: CDP-diacylglycerol--serine O-phosphatidyltransferase [Bacteroidota bacterium]
MRITRAVVPSLFTVLNMFSGFMAIIHASRLEFTAACWFIVLAALFDSLDGVMARITKSASQFGVEIDSLSDVVSFGAAPAFIVFQLFVLEAHEPRGIDILISSLLMILGGLRLARFNVQLVGFDKDHFTGLPIPTSAITIAAFVLNYYSEESGLDRVAATVLPWLVVALSLLMVSKVKYETLPKPTKRSLKKEPWKFIITAAAIIIAVVTGGHAIFPMFLLFIMYGVVRHAAGMVKRTIRHEGKYDDEAVEPTRLEP